LLLAFKRILIWNFLLLLCSETIGQIAGSYGDFLDDRDGRVYQTIKVDSTIWLAENMKFKTENSEIHEVNDYGIDLHGYYYPYNEIDKVCPSGFRIPKTSDWERYIQLLIKLKGVASSSIENVSFVKKGNEARGANVFDDVLKPFESPNPLHLKAHGHTQGGEIVSIGTMNMWIKHDTSMDPKYHLHLHSDGYGIHTHKHHIVKNKKKLRKFSVRCVK